MSEITIFLSARAESELTREMIERLVEAEATRLWHVRRSTPKVKEPGINHEANQLGERLLRYYSKRKERLGTAYPQRYLEQEATIRALVKLGDTMELRSLLEAQLWTK